MACHISNMKVFLVCTKYERPDREREVDKGRGEDGQEKIKRWKKNMDILHG